MENATKALLIAAAVLVAIIIISLTLIVVNQGREAIGGDNLSEADAAAFNANFVSYSGKNVSTAELNTLLSNVYSHNKEELASGDKRYIKIQVKEKAAATTYLAELKIDTDKDVKDQTTVPRLSGSDYYTVTCKYSGNRINEIQVLKVAD